MTAVVLGGMVKETLSALWI